MPFHWLQYILLVIIWRSLAGFIQGVDVAWLLFQDKLRKGSQGWWSSLHWWQMCLVSVSGIILVRCSVNMVHAKATGDNQKSVFLFFLVKDICFHLILHLSVLSCVLGCINNLLCAFPLPWVIELWHGHETVGCIFSNLAQYFSAF